MDLGNLYRKFRISGKTISNGSWVRTAPHSQICVRFTVVFPTPQIGENIQVEGGIISQNGNIVIGRSRCEAGDLFVVKNQAWVKVISNVAAGTGILFRSIILVR